MLWVLSTCVYCTCLHVRVCVLYTTTRDVCVLYSLYLIKYSL